jgi:hypothetical protein
MCSWLHLTRSSCCTWGFKFVPPLLLPCLQLVAGLLKLAPEEAQGKLKGEGMAAQQAAAEEFRKMYDPYDWTKALQ